MGYDYFFGFRILNFTFFPGEGQGEDYFFFGVGHLQVFFGVTFVTELGFLCVCVWGGGGGGSIKILGIFGVL